MELRVESDPTLVITQEHHYYPFGMNLSGIERQGDLMYQFNGMVEKEQTFGLELYETPFRSYDAQLGRFWQVEPLADIYVGVSMYQFGYNNPVSFNDPTGLSSDTGDGKEEKEDIGIIPVGNPLDITPIDGRVIGDYSPRGSSGSKIGGGGYTWDLGNNRASPYSLGGSPQSNPYGGVRSGVNVVLYDKKGNFISGDQTNNLAIVAVVNDKGVGQSKFDFLTTQVKKGNELITHFMTQGELLDRANWAFGEGNGAALLEYAFAIDNIQKRGRSRYTPFSSEATLRRSWKDDTNSYPSIREISGYGAGEVNGKKTNFWYARENNQLNTFKSEFASGTDAISATIIAVLRLQKDPVDGAFQWLGGKRDVLKYHKATQKVVTSSFGDKSYHTFFHIKGH